MFRKQVHRAALRRTNRLNSRHGLRLEPLKHRRVLAVFVVDSLDDYPTTATVDDGTLRGAIMAVNSTVESEQDQIVFDLDDTGPFVIELAAALPAITDNVLLDGTSVDGYSNAPLVVVDGANLGVGGVPAGNGLMFDLGADNSWIRAISVVNFISDENEEDLTGVGILIGRVSNGTGNVSNVAVSESYVGLLPDGTAAGNTIGIGLNDGTDSATIGVGNPETTSGNVVSGNASIGIVIYGSDASNNRVVGNVIGLDPTASQAVPNGGPGVYVIGGAHNNVVGSAFPDSADFDEAYYNIIAGNGGSGVVLEYAGAYNNVSANLIGTNLDDDPDLGNGGAGIEVVDTDNTVIGLYLGAETPVTQRNIISGNAGGGVIVRGSSQYTAISGNFIGTNRDGNVALGNGGVGILIEGDEYVGPTGTLVGMGYGEVEDINTSLGNVIADNTGGGIIVRGAGVGYVSVAGNKIGTDLAGETDIGNDGPGILVEDGGGAGGLTIGLPIWDMEEVDDAYANVISGNDGDGILLDGAGDGVNIQGNIIGLNAAGDAALANAGNGVSVIDSTVTVGLPHFSPEEDQRLGNVISGNLGHGVSITGAESRFNSVAGNFIGPNADGDAAIGNQGSGVFVGDGASYSIIGVSAVNLQEFDNYVNSFEGNVISGNGAGGVTISGVNTHDIYVFGNIIGLDISGQYATYANDIPFGNVDYGVAIVDGAHDNGIGTVRLPIVEFTPELIVDIGTDLNEAQRNVISGNLGDGVRITGLGTDRNAVAGNYVGANKDGDTGLGNGAAGILLADGAQSNRIGNDVFGTLPQLAGNIIASNGQAGVTVRDTTGNLSPGEFNHVSGNFIVANEGDGVLIVDSSATVIGGIADVAGNRIVSNGGNGVHITGDDSFSNVLANNQIGVHDLDEGGEPVAAGNSLAGVLIDDGAHENYVGFGIVESEVPDVDGNVISANGLHGVAIMGSETARNVVLGNFIGLLDFDVDADSAGNAGAGVYIESASDNQIGASLDVAKPALGNVIAHNTGPGARISDLTAPADRNVILQNLVFGNDLEELNPHGIDLLGDANDEQAPPEFAGVWLSDSDDQQLLVFDVTVPGTSGSVRIEVFVHDGNGQGEVYLGSATFCADCAREFFAIELPVGTLTADDSLVATATDSDGNTSQFSAVVGIDAWTTIETTGDIVLDDADSEEEYYELVAALPMELRTFVSDGDGTADAWSMKLMINDKVWRHTGNIVLRGHAELEIKHAVFDHEANPVVTAPNIFDAADEATIVIQDAVVFEANRVQLAGIADMNIVDSRFDHLEVPKDPPGSDWFANAEGLFVEGNSTLTIDGSYFSEGTDFFVGKNQNSTDTPHLNIINHSLFEQHQPANFWNSGFIWSAAAMKVEDSAIRSTAGKFLNWQIGMDSTFEFANVEQTDSWIWHNVSGSPSIDIQGSKFRATIGGEADVTVVDSPDVGFELHWNKGVATLDLALPRFVGNTPYVFPPASAYPAELALIGIGYTISVSNSVATYWQVTVKPDNDVTVRAPNGFVMPEGELPGGELSDEQIQELQELLPEVGFSIIAEAPWEEVELEDLRYLYENGANFIYQGEHTLTIGDNGHEAH